MSVTRRVRASSAVVASLWLAAGLADTDIGTLAEHCAALRCR